MRLSCVLRPLKGYLPTSLSEASSGFGGGCGRQYFPQCVRLIVLSPLPDNVVAVLSLVRLRGRLYDTNLKGVLASIARW